MNIRHYIEYIVSKITTDRLRKKTTAFLFSNRLLLFI
jgi:hypothetical protein